MQVSIAVLAEVAKQFVANNPQSALTIIIGAGAWYELHFGKIAELVENQRVMGTAIYRLMVQAEDLDESQFREDLWGDRNNSPYPRDWDMNDPPEGSA